MLLRSDPDVYCCGENCISVLISGKFRQMDFLLHGGFAGMTE
jgi:hypothetical protein